MADENWGQIKKIFFAALQQRAENRSKFLDRACGGDTALREEVRSLLSSYTNVDSFMEAAAVEEVADEIVGIGKSFEKGQRFGHYEVIRQIGAGGMGEVYLAKDTRLDRHVAVKVLSEKYSHQKSNLNRFISEAKSASALNHPNILVIHEIDESESQHYIVSEYINGKTLREILNEKTLTIAEVLDITIQIASAVTAAHEVRLVHRDIKPENIMVRPDGYAKILDFGLAKLVGQKTLNLENSTVKQNQTEKGVILGTVNYMSPEQAKGESVDERTDIFSIGVVIYEMVAGRTPFGGESVSETLANLIYKQPPPLAHFTTELPEELERIVAKTLCKNADDRYQTMKGLLTDLRSLQRRQEFEAEYLGGTSFEVKDEARKNIEETISPPQTSIAVLPFANISADTENEYFCEGLAEELLNALSKIADLRVAARTSAFFFKGKNREIGEIRKKLGVSKMLEGSVRKSGDRVRINVQLVDASNGFQIWSERFDGEMKDIFDLQDKIALAVIEKLKVKLLGEEKRAVLRHSTNNPEVYRLFLKGRFHWYKQTPESVLKSREYFQKAIELDPAYAPGYAGLGEFYGLSAALGLLPPDVGWQKAEAMLLRAQELDDNLPEVHNGLAALQLMFYRDWGAAKIEFERTIELNPDFAEVYNLYAVSLIAVGRTGDALSQIRRSLELDPLSPTYQRFLGKWLYFSRRFDEAAAEYQNALELDDRNAQAFEELGDLYERMKLYDKAVAAWRQSCVLSGNGELADFLEKTAGEKSFDRAVRAVARKKLARLEEDEKSGKYVPAVEHARQYLRLGNEDKAFEWFEKVIKERNLFSLLLPGDPFYDRIRGNPRFRELIKRIKMPAEQIEDFEITAKTSGEVGISDKTEIKNFAGSDSTSDDLSQTFSIFGSFNIRKRLYLFGLTILLAAVGFGYYHWYFANETPVGKKSLAVLPFVNSSQTPDAEYLADGITENIINNLSQLSGLRVMSRNSAFRFKNNQMDTRAIAAQLGVETLVTGDIRQVGERLVINVRLIDGTDDSQIWGSQFVKTDADIITAQNEIAQAVASNLRLKLTDSERRRLTKNYTENSEAYQLFLRGRFHIYKLTPPEVNKGILYFQKAIEIDPNYALAYSGISEGYRSLTLGSEMPPVEFLAKAKAAANRAVEIDENLADGYVSLGSVSFWQWDWDAAENYYRRAFELKPNIPSGHIFYAHLLSNTGRHEEAIHQIKLARELDPLFPFGNALEGQFLLHAGHVDEALDRLEKTKDLDPNFWMPYLFASSAYIEKEMYTEAIVAARKARELSPFQTIAVANEAYALAKSGKSDEARILLKRLLKLSNERFVPPYHIALIYNGLGEKDEAFIWLERAYQKRDPKMAFLKVEPKWNNLRDEPRFIELIRRMNFN